MVFFLSACGIKGGSNSPLRFKQIANALMIYSIGLDAVDNGGLESKKDGLRLTEGTDLTFTIYPRQDPKP